MKYLQGQHLSYQTNIQLILQKITVSVSLGDKIGLVGVNGAGKSTLLRILANKLKPTTGQIDSQGKISYLSQTIFTKKEKKATLFAYLSKKTDVWWDVLTMLEKEFSLSLEGDCLLSQLSGGELMKINLAIGLVNKPDFWLLDEPTNHLDLVTKNILSKKLKKIKGGLIMVSHDRYFMDQICTKIWELSDQILTIYGGNYSNYEKHKMEKEINDQRKGALIKKKAAVLAHEAAHKYSQAKSLQRKVLRNPYARKLAGKKSLTAMRLKKRAAQEVTRADEEYAVEVAPKSYIDLRSRAHQGSRKLISVKEAQLLLPNKQILLKKINFKLNYGERVVLAGSNSSGKTSFIQSLLGQFKGKLMGNIFFGDPLVVQVLDQHCEVVDRTQTVLNNVRQANKVLNYSEIRRHLGNLLFSDKDDNKLAGELSGGEMAKLALAMIATQEMDLLILDEPTNNLDLSTINVMINVLNTFSGAMIVISHDQYFLQELAVDRTYQIKDGVVKMNENISDL